MGTAERRFKTKALGVALTTSMLSVLLAATGGTAGGAPAPKAPATAPVAVEAVSGSQAECQPGERPETGIWGGVPGFERQPPLGFQGFWCGAVKVGQHALFDRGSFGDVQLIRDERGSCAYASMRTPSDLEDPLTGTVVLDVSVPSQPRDTQILRTPAMLRAYSGFEIQGNTMVAARQNSDEFDVYDVSGDCLQPQFLSTTFTPGHNHDGWLTPDEKTYWGIPWGEQGEDGGPEGLSAGDGMGMDMDMNAQTPMSAQPVEASAEETCNIAPDRIDLHAMDLSDRSNPQPLLTWNRLELPLDVCQRMDDTHSFHDLSTNEAGTRLYVALYGGVTGPANATGPCSNGLMILDSTDVAEGRPNPQLRFISFLSWCDQQIDPDFGDGSSASAHTTEYVIHENGKEYIVTTDEGPALGGSANGMCTQRTYARFIDISDETNPRIVSTFKPDVNKPENCEQNRATNTTGGMVHYVGFDDRYNMRLVFYAASNQGIRVVDFADPENPKEIAYYVKERHRTTSITGTDFTRPDPRYDPSNCFIYTGWNQGGLVTIELTNSEYNPCMRKDAAGEGELADSGGSEFAFTAARRGGDQLRGELQLQDQAAGASVDVDELTFLGSVRDECGSVPATADTLQFEGQGTFNGSPASFMVCVEDNGQGSGSNPDRFHLECTEGCAYSTDETVQDGNIQVRWPTNGYTHQNIPS
jgi:hypothetical protein